MRPPRPTTSAPTCARCRPPGSSRRRWSRWSSRTRVAEKFGGDSVPGDPPQRPVVPRQPADPVSAARRIVLVGPMGVGKSTVGELLAARLGCAFRDTDDGHRRRAGPQHRGHLRRRGRAVLPRDREGGGSTRRSPSTTASSRSAAARSSTRTPGRCSAAQPVVYLSMDVEEAVKRTGLNAARPLLAVEPAQAVARADGGAPPSVRPRSPAPSSPPTAAPPKRSPKRSSTHWS